MVSTPLKNISQTGNLPQIGVKIKNIWNHHPDMYCSRIFYKKHTHILVSSSNSYPTMWGKAPSQLLPCFNHALHLQNNQQKHTVYGWNQANQLRLVVYTIIYRVSYILGGAGFQPSTVCSGRPALISIDASKIIGWSGYICGHSIGSWLVYWYLYMAYLHVIPICI